MLPTFRSATRQLLTAMTSSTQNWQQRATAKRDSVNALIPPEWRVSKLPTREEQKDITGSYLHQYLSKQEVEITETDAVGIAEKTTTGKWKAVDVTKAFCHRAALVHQLTNCLLEIFFTSALTRAAEQDEHFSRTGKPTGPLHGLPISLKDQFHIPGVETTMGYVGWIGTHEGVKDSAKHKTAESELVRELQSLGAVLYCKTSVPHTLMSGESNNNIMGYVWNPKNRNLSAGGSSGGEGALIGGRGSPLGFGTDIGGSVRIPAAFNGLFGLRPSAGRISYEGMANSMDGQNTILSVVGPLATSARSLTFIMKALLSTQPWLYDPLVTEMPWRDDHAKEMQRLCDDKSLAFGIMNHDGVCDTHPPIKRAMSVIMRVLSSLGHETLPWEPSPSHKTLVETGGRAWMYDGGADVHAAFALSGEPPVPQIADVYGDKPVAEYPASYISETNRMKRAMQKEYLDYWNSTASKTASGRPVDAFIMPVAPFTAARPQTYSYVGYTSVINVLDYTSVVIPVTLCDEKVDTKTGDYQPTDGLNRRMAEVYDPNVYDGAHVAVQIVFRRFQEERACVVAEYIEEALRKDKEARKQDAAVKL